MAVSCVLSDSLIRGFASLVFGLCLGLVGIDPLTGGARLTFGIPQLLDGIDVVIVTLGLFAVGEVLYAASTRASERDEIAEIETSIWMSADDWKRSWKPWLRGTAIGFPLGSLPAGGAEIPTLLSYALERRLSKTPEQFGRGAIEGVAGPEAANNASAAGTLVPLLTLGLPTSATAAVMLAAFQQYGLQPGPRLFAEQGRLVWALIASLYIGNVMLLVLNLPLLRVWVNLLKIPKPLLYAGILTIASLGGYGLNQSVFDIAVMYVIGLAGYAMRQARMPLAPAVIGVILGPIAEQHFRRALAIGEGSPLIFFTRPLSCALLVVAVVLLIIPFLVRRRPAPST